MGARAQHAFAYRQLCARLRGWREGAGLTQRALALRMGKPHSYVWKTEAGERRIDPIEFVAWCRACDVQPAKAIEEFSR